MQTRTCLDYSHSYYSATCSRCFYHCFAMNTMTTTAANALHCFFDPSCVPSTLLSSTFLHWFPHNVNDGRCKYSQVQVLATIFKNCVFLLLKQLITQTHLLQAYSFRSPACFMCCDTYHSCGCSRCFCRCFAMTTMKITTANALNCSFNLSCVANTLLKIGKVICVKHVAPHITYYCALLIQTTRAIWSAEARRTLHAFIPARDAGNWFIPVTLSLDTMQATGLCESCSFRQQEDTVQ